jgi:hypothetical protein
MYCLIILAVLGSSRQPGKQHLSLFEHLGGTAIGDLLRCAIHLVELYNSSSLVTVDPLQKTRNKAMRQLSSRKEMPSPRLSAAEFRKRFLSQSRIPHSNHWRPNSTRSRLRPGTPMTAIARARTRARPAANSPIRTMSCRSFGWAARAAIADAQRRHDDRSTPAILLINGSSRSEHTCPGEMSKSYRLLESHAKCSPLRPTSRSRCST